MGQEIKTSLLLRTALPEDVIIESARIGNTDYSDGTFELDVYPLGLVEPAVFYLRRKDDEEEYFTVVWDPITGGARVRRGKEEPE